MKTYKVSVVIPTRNRHQNLMHNLGSLLTQSIVPDEIVVIDNNSSDKTKEVVRAVARNSKVKVKYVLEKRKGYSFAYNRGLKHATNDWVAFLDDDCIATHDWYKNIVKAINKHPQTTVFLGNYDPRPIDHYLGLTDSFIKSLGLCKINKKGQILDFEILDSKNIVYKKKFLTQNKIKFDESLMLLGGGSSEDCDLGMQIQKAGGSAIYEPKIKIYHKEITDFISYYKKLVSRTKDHLVYEEKWQEVRKRMGFSRIGPRLFLRSLQIFIKKRELSLIKTSLVVLNVILSFVFIKIIYLLYGKS